VGFHLVQQRTASTFRRNTIIACAIGAGALAIAVMAHLHGRPVTAALLAMFGVTAIGALLGVRAGVIAGIIASLSYNLFLTDPLLRLTLPAADDLVPIIALNVSAIASGIIAGRLHDRAIAAESASRLVSELLTFSQALQKALGLDEIEQAARQFIAREEGTLQLFIEHDGQLVSPSTSESGEATALEVWHSRLPELRLGDEVGVSLKSGDRRLGVVVVDAEGTRPADHLMTFLPLLALAVQRWILATKLTETEAIKRSEKFKTTLLSSVSHDLRTPLAAISASASSLRRFQTELDAETKAQLLEAIEEQCARLDRLTTNLLNIGRIEGGLDVKQMPVIDAVEVLGSALARVRQVHAGHQFEKDFQIKSGAVRADEPLLEQVFVNVLENAAVHTGAGTTVKVSSSPQPGCLLISVEDDGDGIPKADRTRIFERFFQGGSDSRVKSGSGLGLSIAKGFAERVGGSIRACSAEQPLRGAKIEIELPLVREQ
jgi:two-component system sensor histidine kinase KdpD